ncbi:MAG: PEP-CTERM sorting domain-containing protein [Planctomycetota bacterium]
MKICILRSLALACVVAVTIGWLSPRVTADEVSFLVDPTTIDSNMDGFITGNEFQPVGTDGTVFLMTPTNNLVGADRFLLSDTTGLHFGGGGGSSLEFEFSVSNDIMLETYTIPDHFSILGNPTFDIVSGMTTLSSGNDSDMDGTFSFAGGPVMLEAGTTYTVDVTNFGAGIQSFMTGWGYSNAIPEPGTLSLLAVAGLGMVSRRIRR